MNNIKTKELILPIDIIKNFKINKNIKKTIKKCKIAIHNILYGKDDRIIVIIGPCSIHNIKEAMIYASKLMLEKKKFENELEIIMRVYFEKPRTIIGWKGMINDPYINNSFKINYGLKLARKLLIDINILGLPVGTEFLNIITTQYISDLISWGCIGARTVESQTHRELASNLSCPIGFKNSTNGNIKTAIDAVKTASRHHHFISINNFGKPVIVSTIGNKNCHIILRGGSNKYTNFDKKSIQQICKNIINNNLIPNIIIDASHDNSYKKQKNQIKVCNIISKQIYNGNKKIVGIMIESNLISGKQEYISKKKLIYGKSITDECIDFESSLYILKKLSKAVKNRRLILKKK